MSFFKSLISIVLLFLAIDCCASESYSSLIMKHYSKIQKVGAVAFIKEINSRAKSSEIIHVASKECFDTNLCIAIMAQESAFNVKAVSKGGDRGLMQINPVHGKAPLDIKKNIQMGSKILRDNISFFSKYDTDVYSVIMNSIEAYNRGAGRVIVKWKEKKISEDYICERFICLE